MLVVGGDTDGALALLVIALIGLGRDVGCWQRACGALPGWVGHKAGYAIEFYVCEFGAC